MNVIICGAGEVGRHAAEVLGARGTNITIIDREQSKLDALESTLDVRILRGSGTHANLLMEAGCASADLFLAATNIDEINILAASIAKAVGARTCVARVHHSVYFERQGLDYGAQFGIDHLVCPEYSTALAIAQVLRTPGALAVERFAGGRIEMQQLPVTADAPAIGQPLISLDLPKATRIAAINRGGSVFIPDAQTRIQFDDVVTIIGQSESFERACRLMDRQAGRRKHVIIMGGSSMGVWLCRALQGRTFSIRLIEPNRQRAEELAAKLDWVTVLCADITDPMLFDEERVAQADSFVALSDDDEQNILTAARAKSVGAAEAIAVQQRGTYLHLIEHVGIDRAFSPRVAAVAELQQLLDTSPVKQLASLAKGVADVYEVRVSAAATDIVGVPLKQTKLPARTIIAVVQRGESAFVPGADDQLQADDMLVIIGPAGIAKELRRVFNR